MNNTRATMEFRTPVLGLRPSSFAGVGLILLPFILLAAADGAEPATKPVDYMRDVKPILSERSMPATEC